MVVAEAAQVANGQAKDSNNQMLRGLLERLRHDSDLDERIDVDSQRPPDQPGGPGTDSRATSRLRQRRLRQSSPAAKGLQAPAGGGARELNLGRIQSDDQAPTSQLNRDAQHDGLGVGGTRPARVPPRPFRAAPLKRNLPVRRMDDVIALRLRDSDRVNLKSPHIGLLRICHFAK